MNGEHTAPAATPEPIAPTELQPGQAAPGSDGVVAPTEQQTQEGQTPGEPAASPAPEERKEPSRFDKRFSELSRKTREAELRAARAEGALEVLRSGAAQPAAPPTATAPDPRDVEPSPDDYPGKQFDPQYLRDIARFDARMELRAEQARSEEARKAAELQTREHAEFEAGRARFVQAVERAEQLEDADPRYEGVAATLAHIARADRGLVDIISDSENPEWLAAHLRQNPQFVPELIAMPAHKRAMTIGAWDHRITENLNAARAKQSAPAAPASSQQPTPTPQVNGRGAAPFNAETASMEDYVRWRQSQM